MLITAAAPRCSRQSVKPPVDAPDVDGPSARRRRGRTRSSAASSLMPPRLTKRGGGPDELDRLVRRGAAGRLGRRRRPPPSPARRRSRPAPLRGSRRGHARTSSTSRRRRTTVSSPFIRAASRGRSGQDSRKGRSSTGAARPTAISLATHCLTFLPSHHAFAPIPCAAALMDDKGPTQEPA